MSGFKVYDEKSEWPKQRPTEFLQTRFLRNASARLSGNSAYLSKMHNLAIPSERVFLRASCALPKAEHLSKLCGAPFAFRHYAKVKRDALEKEFEARRLSALAPPTDKVRWAIDYAMDGFNFYPYTPFADRCPDLSTCLPGIYKITAPKLKNISKTALLYEQFPFVYFAGGPSHG